MCVFCLCVVCRERVSRVVGAFGFGFGFGVRNTMHRPIEGRSKNVGEGALLIEESAQ